MSAIPGIVATEMALPTNARSRLAAAIMSTVHYADSFTDILIHEDEPIRLKSAKGNVTLQEMGIPGGDVVVSAADIQYYFSTYVDNGSVNSSVGSYWRNQVVPTLAAKMAVNKSLPTPMPTGQYLRFSLFQHNRGKLALVVRVTSAPANLESIGLTEQLLSRIRNHPHGLLVITGPTASGKTATALSILEWLNHNRGGHIVTVEDPIEYPMKGRKCVFTQREVGVDVSSFGEGLRDAMRHAPDAILAGEVRDRESSEMAIYGGESGVLMIVTTHGRSVTGTLRKMLALCGENSIAMREVLAGSLIGVVRQELVPAADRNGYYMVADTLHMTDNVRGMVAHGKWNELDKLTNHYTMPSPDFVPMKSRLDELVSASSIDPKVASMLIPKRFD